jgi:hypothetical protein
MAISINISGTIIEIPESGAAPSWADAWISFAQAVEAALSATSGAYDVPPQVFNIDIYNPGVDIALPLFSFPVSAVRGVDISYCVFRNTSVATAAEKGTLQAVYNPAGPVGNKWNVSRDFTGDGQISFSITDTGTVTFTTATIAGSNHIGRISYAAKAILQS